MHHECSAGISLRPVNVVKAIRTMYREKPRYVHLNVKRTSAGKRNYIKNNGRGLFDGLNHERACVGALLRFNLVLTTFIKNILCTIVKFNLISHRETEVNAQVINKPIHIFIDDCSN